MAFLQGNTVERLAPPGHSDPADPLGGSQPARVLVVDDEDLLLGMMRRILHGFQVETTTDARDALGRIAAGATFDVILVDLTMPGMSGIEFYHALRASRPPLAERVLFMSGGVYEADLEAFLDSVPNGRIAKPFRAAALRDAVHEVARRT